MNKRDFMAGAGAGAFAAVCVPVVAANTSGVQAALPSARRLPPLEGWQRRDTWARYVGQDFRTAAGVLLRLRRIDAATVPSPATDQFRLVFSASDGAAVDTGLHELHHATGQRLAVYLDAAAAGELHAHFNLLV